VHLELRLQLAVGSVERPRASAQIKGVRFIYLRPAK
jgi:hypothetical protein